jgi:hypothetical protein
MKSPGSAPQACALWMRAMKIDLPDAQNLLTRLQAISQGR